MQLSAQMHSFSNNWLTYVIIIELVFLYSLLVLCSLLNYQ
jgi:hypothetical protein